MLTWTEIDGKWFGNGFRIERSDRGDWRLTENTAEESAGPITMGAPLADLPTLSACKYKAEAIHEVQRVSELRQRLGAVIAGAASLAVLGAGNPIVVIVCLVVGGAAGLELMSTWFEGRVGGAREIRQ